MYDVFLKQQKSQTSPHQQTESLIHMLKNLVGVKETHLRDHRNLGYVRPHSQGFLSFLPLSSTGPGDPGKGVEKACRTSKEKILFSRLTWSSSRKQNVHSIMTLFTRTKASKAAQESGLFLLPFSNSSLFVEAWMFLLSR